MNVFLRLLPKSKMVWIVIAIVLAIGIATLILLKPSSAVTATLIPDATNSNQWVVSTPGCDTNTTGHTCIDEGTPADANDVIGTGTSLGQVSANFSMSNQSNVATATQLTLHMYAWSVVDSRGIFDTVSMSLNVGGTSLAATDRPMTASGAWYAVTYNGNWTQTQVDNIQAVFTRNVVGSGNASGQDDYVRIASAYITMTYEPPAVVTQAAYRWLKPDGAVAADGTFSTDYIDVKHTTSGSSDLIDVKDLNNDGVLDLVVASPFADIVSVLLGNGDDTYAPKVDYATGDNPNHAVVSDLNGDQIPDIAAVNRLSDTISIFINNGNGTFAAKVDYTSGTEVYRIVAADFDGDQDIDIAIADYEGGTMSVLLNNGNGTFAAKVNYTAGVGAYGIAVGDVNNDQIIDVVVSNDSADVISIFINNGNGTFAAKVDYPAGGIIKPISVADLNNDQFDDIVSSNISTNTITVFMNNGNGTFAPRVEYSIGAGVTDITIGDFNNDQNNDIAANSIASPARISVYLNNGDGTFAPQATYATGSSVSGLIAIDLNNDQALDLATNRNEQFTTSGVIVLPGNRSAPFTPLADISTPAVHSEVDSQFNLRLNLGVSVGSLSTTNAYKLRYQQKVGASCSSNPADYNDITSSSAIRFYDNSSIVDDTAMISSVYDPVRSGVTALGQKYKESNPFTPRNTIPSGQDGLWDFSLAIHSAAPVGSYCFMATKNDSTAIDSYAVMPELIVPEPTIEQSSYRLYENADLANPGNPLAAQNTPAILPTDSSFRLRQLLHQTTGKTAVTDGFKLQVAEKITTCVDATYSDSIGGITFVNNPAVADEAVITSLGADPTPSSGAVLPQTYSENAAITTPAEIITGENGLWDFAIAADSSTAGNTYCFRIVRSDDSALTTYTHYPEIAFTVTGPTLLQQLRGGQAVVNGQKTPFSW